MQLLGEEGSLAAREHSNAGALLPCGGTLHPPLRFEPENVRRRKTTFHTSCAVRKHFLLLSTRQAPSIRAVLAHEDAWAEGWEACVGDKGRPRSASRSMAALKLAEDDSLVMQPAGNRSGLPEATRGAARRAHAALTKACRRGSVSGCWAWRRLI